MARRFIPRKITESQKAAAHNLFRNVEKGDAPKSDLGVFYPTNEAEDATRRRYMDPLQEDLRAAAEQVRERPSRVSRRTDTTAMLERGRAALLTPTLVDAIEAGAKAEQARVERAAAPRYVPVDLDKHEDMAGRLHGREAVLNYIRAGNATVTLVSRRTGTRYTFKFQRPKDWEPGPQRPVAPVFCKVMTGADNEGDFTFVGTMWPENSMFPDGPQVYRHGKSTRVSFSAMSVKGLIWFVRTALAPGNDALLERCEVWHEGRCGRCGRKLTVPSSIESGYGPECIGKVGL